MLERGFLGTNASLVSDLSLVLGVLVALTLTIGVVLARRKRLQAHRWVQSTAVLLNVLQVAVVMLGSFMKSAAPGIPHKVNETYYTIAVAHGLLGLATLLLGVFIAIRANELLPGFLHFLRFHNFKLVMRSAYGLYMASTLLGVGVYAAWYGPTRPAELTQAALATEELVVPMANFEFSPRDLVVPVGTTLVWLNQDAAPHTATADDGQTFSSDLLARGQSFRFTASAPGEFSYFCELHGSSGGIGMAGKVTVVAGDLPLPAVAAAAAPIVASTPTAESAPTAGLPNQGVQHLLLDGPGLPFRQGYVVGLRRETQELLRHARLLTAAESTGDLAGVRRHAEHSLNLIVGSAEPAFGDHDGDGSIQNPGDGFGLLANGDQPGYLRATFDAALAAELAPDASETVTLHAGYVRLVIRDNMHDWASEARQLAFALTTVNDLRAVEQPASRLLVLAKWLELGNDLNGDGEITPVPGEGGGLVAYEHARFLAHP